MEGVERYTCAVGEWDGPNEQIPTGDETWCDKRCFNSVSLSLENSTQIFIFEWYSDVMCLLPLHIIILFLYFKRRQKVFHSQTRINVNVNDSS